MSKTKNRSAAPEHEPGTVVESSGEILQAYPTPPDQKMYFHDVHEAIHTAHETMVRKHHYASKRCVEVRQTIAEGDRVDLPDLVDAKVCLSLVMRCGADVVLSVNGDDGPMIQLERDVPLIWHINQEKPFPLPSDGYSFWVKTISGPDAATFILEALV